MKTIDSLRCLSRQQAEDGKRVFCVTELANIADTSAAVMNVELSRLVRRGVICRYMPGTYGLPEGVAVEDLVRAIDSDAYVPPCGERATRLLPPPSRRDTEIGCDPGRSSFARRLRKCC